jgi:hypothetical protein
MSSSRIDRLLEVAYYFLDGSLMVRHSFYAGTPLDLFSAPCTTLSSSRSNARRLLAPSDCQNSHSSCACGTHLSLRAVQQRSDDTAASSPRAAHWRVSPHSAEVGLPTLVSCLPSPLNHDVYAIAESHSGLPVSRTSLRGLVGLEYFS